MGIKGRNSSNRRVKAWTSVRLLIFAFFALLLTAAPDAGCDGDGSGSPKNMAATAVASEICCDQNVPNAMCWTMRVPRSCSSYTNWKAWLVAKSQAKDATYPYPPQKKTITVICDSSQQVYTLNWESWEIDADDVSTDYLITAEISADSSGHPRQWSVATPQVRGQSQTTTIYRADDPCSLRVWIGDRRYGSASETDTIGFGRSYALVVRSCDVLTGIPHPGDSVEWEVDDTSCARVDRCDSVTNSDGLAACRVALIGSAESGDFVVKAMSDVGDVEFNLQCIGQQDRDTLLRPSPPDTLPSKLHQQYTGSGYHYYEGDGLWGTVDSYPDVKNVYLEVDWEAGYCLSYSVVTQDIVPLVQSIFATGGMKVCCSVDSEGITVGRKSSSQEFRALLAEERDPGLKGIGDGAIHVILGGALGLEGSHEDSILGQTMIYGRQGYPDDSLRSAMHKGSTFDNSGDNAYLDSCGCTVYVDNAVFQDVWWHFEEYPDMTFCELTALAMAHEVGHAIGLDHWGQNPQRLMSREFNPKLPYGSYNRFANPTLDEVGYFQQVNLRQVLGRETAEIYTYRVDGTEPH
jgi:hypothetical protein